MAMGLNKVCLLGNVGLKPEIRTMQDGRELASFKLATSQTWKEKGTDNKKTKTEWHRIVVFSEGLVKVIKNYVDQGTKLYIEGSIQTKKWTGTDNIERTSTEIILQGYNSVLLLLDSKGQSANVVIEREPVEKEPPQIIQDKDGPHIELMEELDDEVPF
jgi:single-strand DNA-binding protein